MKKKFCWTNLVLHNLVKRVPMQMVLHDDYQRILGPLGFRWFPNGWKLERIESTPINVSSEQLLLNKVKPMQEKQKKNRMKLDLRVKVENPNILLYVQPHPQGILPF